MTISTTHIENTFTGNASTTVFNFTFQVLRAADVRVQLGGVVQSVGFTKSLNANQETSPGGSVTFSSAPGSGVAVKIDRLSTLTQEVAFTRESLLNTENLELVLDNLTLMLQEAAARTQGTQGIQGEVGPQGPTGDVGGPASSTDGALAIWDGTGGNLLADGPVPTNEGDILQVVSGVWAASAAAASLPSGLIALWDTNMASVPTGWAAMNGQTVTINGVSKVTLDTRGKYVLAAAEDDTGSSGYTGSTVRPGTVSGTKTHLHGQNGTVSIAAAFDTGVVSAGAFGAASGGGGSVAQIGTLSYSSSGHTHGAIISGNTQASTDSARPIEAALLLIIKVDE